MVVVRYNSYLYKKTIMKAIVLIICISIAATASAQITITGLDIPLPGDTFMLYVDKTPSVSLGTAQPTAQYWNFNGLTNDSVQYASYGVTANMSFGPSFPASNLFTWGPAALYGGPGNPSPGTGTGYMLFSSSDTGMYVVGYRANYDGSGEKNVFQNPRELLIPVPATYGYNSNTNSSWNIYENYNPGNYDTLYVSKTNKILTIDAWGALTTPYDSFPSVLRLHELSVTVDSVFIKVSGVTVYSLEWRRDTVNKYSFINNGARHPVTVAYCSPSGVLERVEYLSWSQLPVSENFQSEGLKVWPVPANDRISLDLPSNEVYTITVFDLQGRIILEKENLTGNENILDCSSWPVGNYLIDVRGKNGYRGIAKAGIVR
jgi:hypothetical protein